MEARLLSLSEKRLARIFRRAALQHIRRELREASATLADAAALLEAEGRESWAPGLAFVREWGSAVDTERRGLSLHAAPAAWIHLSQELASVLEAGGDWIEYLHTRWTVESGRLPWGRRAGYGILSVLALGLSGAVLLLLARHAAQGNWDGLTVGAMRTALEKALTLTLLFARVAGTVLLVEQGVRWGRKAFSGRGEEPRVLFLGRSGGLAIAENPHT